MKRSIESNPNARATGGRQLHDRRQRAKRGTSKTLTRGVRHIALEGYLSTETQTGGHEGFTAEPPIEILAPLKREGLLIGTEAIAEEYFGTRSKWRTIQNQCAYGRFAAWKQGGVWYSTKQLVTLWKLINALATMNGTQLDNNDVMLCGSSVVKAINNEELTDQYVEELLRKLSFIKNKP